MTLIENKKVKPLFVLAVIFIACLCVYFNGLQNSFILDDNFLIANNLYVKNFALDKIFTSDVFHFQAKQLQDGAVNRYYRPLQLATYSFEYRIWKLNPLGYRIDNIILHSLNSFFIFLIVLYILKNQALALLSALLFSIHPSSVCLVTFIAGRSNLLEMFFILLCLVSFLRFIQGKSGKWYYFSLLLYIAAFFTREGAVLVPLYIAACSLFTQLSRKKAVILLLPYIIIAALYIGLRSMLMPCGKFAPDALTLSKVRGFIFNIQGYFWQLVFPLKVKVGLFSYNLLIPRLFFIFTLALFIYTLTKCIFKKDKAISLSLLLYFIGLLPLVNLGELIKYFGPALSEHYVYNACIGFCLGLSYFILRFKIPVGRVVAACIFIYFSVTTVITNTYYKDDVSFYNYTLSLDKNNPIAHLNLGNALYEKKDFRKAIEEAEQVLKIEPVSWDAYLLIGNIYMSANEPEKAIDFYNRALLLNPLSYEANNNLGVVYKQKQDYVKAAEYFKKALELNPESEGALSNLDNLYVK